MTTITGAGGLTFNLNFDPSTSSAPSGFITDFDAVAQWYADHIHSTATITLNVGWGEVGGFSLPSNALGASSYNFNTDTYSQIHNALVGHSSGSADDVSALASLGSSDPTNGGNFVISTALGRQLGLVSGSGNDGSVGFGTGFTYNFDPSNRTVGGYDFFGVAGHEIAETMGRVADLGKTIGAVSNTYSAMDLFRYSGAGTRDLTSGGYMSPDGGATNLNNFNSGSGDAGDWASSAGQDAYDAFNPGGEGLITEADLRTLDSIGWNVVNPYNPSAFSADGTTLTTTTGSLTTAFGTFALSSTTNQYGHQILVNGQDAYGGSGSELEVANGGRLYAENAQGNWYVLNGANAWAASSNPNGGTISPDGSTLLSSDQTDRLTTADGVWSFSAQSNQYGNLILLNGASAANGSAAELEVAQGGHLFADNTLGNWYEWNGAGWAAAINPNNVSPDGTILLSSDTTDHITSNAGTWSFSTSSNQYGNLVLLNGQSAANGSAVELEVAQHGNLFAENNLNNWYEWSGSGWSASGGPGTQLVDSNQVTFADMTDKPPEGMGSAPATLSFDPPKDGGTAVVMTADQPSFLLPALL